MTNLPIRKDLIGRSPYGAPQIDVPVRLNTNENPFGPSPELVSELTKVISNNMHVNIQSISLSGEAGIFYGQVAVIVHNNVILKKLIENIKKIDGIDKVTRVYTN